MNYRPSSIDVIDPLFAIAKEIKDKEGQVTVQSIYDRYHAGYERVVRVVKCFEKGEVQFINPRIAQRTKPRAIPRTEKYKGRYNYSKNKAEVKEQAPLTPIPSRNVSNGGIVALSKANFSYVENFARESSKMFLRKVSASEVVNLIVDFYKNKD